jgi:hypothetical protein
VERTLLQRIHNPRNCECGCAPDCWCRRATIGRAVKWWFPARYFGIHHKSAFFDGWTVDQIREWKREQSDKGASQMVAQPKYEEIVRLGPRRWAMTVRLPNGQRVLHQVLGHARVDSP